MSREYTVQCYIDVALDLPMNQSFTYAVSAHEKGLSVGALVQVPWRKKSMTGIVIKIYNKRPIVVYKIRPIIAIVDTFPILSQAMIEMLSFMSNYYQSSLGSCLSLAIPRGVSREGECVYSLIEESKEKANEETEFDEDFAQLQSLLKDGEIKASQIFEQTKITYSQLDEWQRRGILRGRWILKQERREESTFVYVEAIKDAVLPKRLGSKQGEILAYIRENERLTQTAINQVFTGGGSVLKRLHEMGLIRMTKEAAPRSIFDFKSPEIKEITLTLEQQIAIEEILEQKQFRGFLLHGVTGSGKTEVYLRVMAEKLREKKSCLLILPEIGLTPQFCALFNAHFGDEVAVLHSGLGDAERFNTWSRIKDGEHKIVIGARSALFAPLMNLGVIVIDEEHDSSFKQGENPRYHARDMALVLGQKWNCPVILGSATPSLESYLKSRSGKFSLLSLSERPNARPLPSIELIDMCKANREEIDPDLDEEEKARLDLQNRLISQELKLALAEELEKGAQAIIFLNRRGHSTFVQCSYCGYAVYCPHCAVSMTYHQFAKQLRCHYCDYQQALPERCPKCLRQDIGLLGYGTERLVQILRDLFPNARIDRLDRDRASSKGLRSVLGNFREGKIDILVGTQMLAKGHDIHNVTLVGVISADLSLNLPDFRAGERAFQLLTQVAGRAGRGERKGRVLIQTLRPDHPVLEAVSRGNFEAFALEELRIRQALQYPPFIYLALLRIEGDDVIAVENAAQKTALLARRFTPKQGIVLGPAPAPIMVLRGKFRYQIMLKHPTRSLLHPWISKIDAYSSGYFKGKTRIIVDIDPIDMM